MQSTASAKLILALTLIYLTIAQQNTPLSIVTGPIIGKVTTTTARVLIEFNTQASVTLILTDPAGNQVNTTRDVPASIPVPFIFEDLAPNTRYAISLGDPEVDLIESYFTTLSGESGKLNFAVASCMDQGIHASKEPRADLWADMLRRVQNNEVSYLLQTGDQVYMDDPAENQDLEKPYFAFMRIINETAQDQWEDRRQELLEILRNEYRQTWNLPNVKATLSKVPSLTLLDDHQIRDDWGYLPEDTDPNSADYYYGVLARQVYYEYERQLREDIDFNNLSNMTQDYYYEVLNDIGFFFIDYRGIRSWNRDYSQVGDSQLGLNQTQLLQDLLNPETGAFANATSFFLVSPLTVVFLTEEMMRLGYYSINDAQESWTYAYENELIELLALLRNWKLARDGREVVVLSGDIHMGGFTDITYDDDFAFLQFTTSSIASSAPSNLVFLGFNIIKEIESLRGQWSYEHHDWTNKYNYGIVLADYDGQQASTDCFLVQASSDEDPEIRDVDGSSVSESEWDQILQRA